MVRYEKVEGDIHIAWGYDEGLDGFFLSVVDRRLAWRGEASDDVNKICKKVAMDGGGSYFNLNTYSVGGFGHKVSMETIFSFMLRYGIDVGKMDLSKRKVEPGDDKTTMYMHAGGETPELRISQDYIKRRRERIQRMIEESATKPVPILVARVDRTITELSEQYGIPIVRKGVFPPTVLSCTIIFFAQDVYPMGFQECAHPDCRFPEMEKVKYKKCSRCKQAAYCSKTCQKDDWKTHKKNCQEIKQ